MGLSSSAESLYSSEKLFICTMSVKYEAEKTYFLKRNSIYICLLHKPKIEENARRERETAVHIKLFSSLFCFQSIFIAKMVDYFKYFCMKLRH